MGHKGNKDIRPEDGVQFGKGNKAAEKWPESEALRLANELIDWMREKDENVFFEEFVFLAVDAESYKGKIYPSLLAYLDNKFSSFSKLLDIARKIEEVKIKKYCAFDKMNAGFGKFLLSAQYGYTEKQNLEVTTPDTIKIEYTESDDIEIKSSPD